MKRPWEPQRHPWATYVCLGGYRVYSLCRDERGVERCRATSRQQTQLTSLLLPQRRQARRAVEPPGTSTPTPSMRLGPHHPPEEPGLPLWAQRAKAGLLLMKVRPNVSLGSSERRPGTKQEACQASPSRSLSGFVFPHPHLSEEKLSHITRKARLGSELPWVSGTPGEGRELVTWTPFPGDLSEVYTSRKDEY